MSEFGLDDLVIGGRIGATGVDEVQQDGCALDVAQELVAQTLTLASALNEAGDVGHEEAEFIHVDHTEIRHQSGEGISSDFGFGIGDY